MAIFAKTLGQALRILSKNLSFFKTWENSYTGPLCITDPQSGDHNQEKLSSGQFLSRSGDFHQNHRLTPTDLSKNLNFFKTCENSYTGPLCITDLQSGDHNLEKISFGQFLPQTGDFR
jgi:hypothetical protein